MRCSLAGYGIRASGVVIAAGLVILAACGGQSAREEVAEKAIEGALEQSGGKADVDLAKEKATITTPEGKTEISFGEQAWPTDLPEGVPAFTFGRIKGVNRSEQDGGKAWNIVLEDVEVGALEKYARILEASDWSIMTSLAADKGGMIQATRGDLMVIVMVNAEKRVASVAVAPQG